MFYLNKNEELNIELLQKMISKFNIEVAPKLQRYKNYYDGIQDILNKSYADEYKPCNKTIINYCANIVNSYAGYIGSPGHISYASDSDIDDIMSILNYNDYQAQDASLLLDALIYGVACEIMYIDEQGKTRFRLLNPAQCFGVYDDTLTGDLMYFVRMYKASEWDNTDLYYVDVYTDHNIKHFAMNGRNGYLTYKGEEAHYFSQCPANIFYLPNEKSIFDCIMSLQDSANELLSSEIDDYSAFCDAHLALFGVDAEEEDIIKLRRDRVICLPEGANASWLTKNANDTQIENILKRIHDSIYRVAQCPDFSSENFVGGVSSGVSIKFKLSGIEFRAGKIEAEMKKALQRRIEIICGIASLKLGEEIYRDIEITFKRNTPKDTTAIINLVNSLKGTVSDATLLAQLDFVPDVNEELERLKAQKEEEMALYSFGENEEEVAV